ncbi:PREDICTED: glutathione S-transferase T1-like isoform X2 [Ipomoea nil]|uniref:glutathione S-transferase T1-like isoform X2 n=1 Tax=Ipomoea nil TaxID=35883 RepID=UPI000900BF58|nr:PREDICTED: glutathione S-transferase T1-like isoform X2 [Ipomoea nil]
MTLKLYVDRMSQPSRALLIFCKANGIEFEEVQIELSKAQHRTPEFGEINPMKQVPAMVDGDFTLFERYPADLRERAMVDSVLDWHHSNLRRGSVGYLLNGTFAPALGLPLNSQAAAEGEKLLSASLNKIDSFWLQGNGKFLLGNTQPSIADLSLICEITELQVVDEKDHDRILSPFKKVVKWIEDVKEATAPHFDEVHTTLYNVKEMMKQQRSEK